MALDFDVAVAMRGVRNEREAVENAAKEAKKVRSGVIDAEQMASPSSW